MRNTFIKTLVQEAKKDPDIFLITGDLGFMALEPYINALPKQFLNIGVAEQNMVGFAAGLALTGKKVYCYSIAPFAVMRPFEFIRNDVCYHNLNVKIIGLGAGYSYSYNGPTHYGLEDIGIMRTLPNMTVICPGDPMEVVAATKASVAHNGPMYIRLGKTGEPMVHQKQIQFKVGKAIEVLKGKDACIIATSNMLENSVMAANLLKKQNINCRVLSMHTVKPIDKIAIIKAAKETKVIFTIEEHNIIGGLGSAVAEVLAESKIGVVLKRLGANDIYPTVIGSQKFLRELNGLSVESLIKEIKTTVE